MAGRGDRRRRVAGAVLAGLMAALSIIAGYAEGDEFRAVLVALVAAFAGVTALPLPLQKTFVASKTGVLVVDLDNGTMPDLA
jgi:hypothetical protein